MENNTTKISVRNLVEFVLRSGNIDSAYMGSKRAVEGTIIHQRIQKQRIKEAKLNGFTYESEVTLKNSIEFLDYVFEIEGRADGVIIGTNEKDVTIEEIKSTTRNLNDIKHDKNHWHFAQCKCYAYIYCKLHNLEAIKLMLTYCHVETGEVLIFDDIVTLEELTTFLFEILEKYYEFTKLQDKIISDRNETATKLPFPYTEYRKGQRELATTVYKTFYEGKKLLVEAPTGTGKTISTLFPAVKALSTQLIEKVFYITAKTITREVAKDAFLTMERSGLIIRAIILTAKEKICLLNETKCNPIDCVYACGHFDRVNRAILDILENETIITREIVKNYSLKHMVCPFEFQLDVSFFCDAIVCDYNYVYDPSASLKRFFSEGNKTNYAILHDESHNLVDRARDMFSKNLSLSMFLKTRSTIKERKLPIYKQLTKICNFLKDLNLKNLELSVSDKNSYTAVEKLKNEDFVFLLNDFIFTADKWLTERKNETGNEEVLQLYFDVISFTKISEMYDERYVTIIDGKKTDVNIKLTCLDPSFLLSLVQKQVKSSIFFSATLSPIEYYRDILGASTDDFGLILETPFEHENLCVLVENKISTKYEFRESSYEKIADYIYTIATSKTGNYFAFFPSYVYMEHVYNAFMDKHFEDENVVAEIQSMFMNEKAREEFLEMFVENPSKSLIGFLVLGGVFSEGIDLVGERLIGAIITSVGIPMITPERNVIADFYKNNKLDGFAYAYRFPGMNKVLQACGRVIRSEKDKGIVFLIDSRYTENYYLKLFPYHWKNYSVVNTTNLTQKLDDFWSG